MLNPAALGLAVGTLWGVTYFLFTLWHIFRGRGPCPHFMGHHLIGYRRSFKGAVVVLFWGLFLGFLSGYLIATIYNFIKNIIFT